MTNLHIKFPDGQQKVILCADKIGWETVLTLSATTDGKVTEYIMGVNHKGRVCCEKVDEPPKIVRHGGLDGE